MRFDLINKSDLYLLQCKETWNCYLKITNDLSNQNALRFDDMRAVNILPSRDLEILTSLNDLMIEAETKKKKELRFDQIKTQERLILRIFDFHENEDCFYLRINTTMDGKRLLKIYPDIELLGCFDSWKFPVVCSLNDAVLSDSSVF